MKWAWWIGGALLYLMFKDRNGNDSPLMIIGLIVVLTVFSLLGQGAASRQKRKEQEERDRAANEAAKTMLDDVSKNKNQREQTGKSGS